MPKRRHHAPITDERLQELRQMPYEKYLQSPEWYRRRAVALTLAEGRCALCNSPDSLNVHHRTYTRDGVSILGAEKMADLTVLCKSCHRTFHEQRQLHRDPRKPPILSPKPPILSPKPTSTLGPPTSNTLGPPTSNTLAKPTTAMRKRKPVFVEPPLPPETWAIGETAIHPKLGACEIVSVDPPEMVLAHFAATDETKSLSLRYANLQKLNREVG